MDNSKVWLPCGLSSVVPEVKTQFRGFEKMSRKRKRLEAVCRANGCDKVLLITETEKNTVILCSSCNRRIQRLCDKEGMHWFTAHLDESYIMASSRPEILPSSTLPLERVSPDHSPVEAIRLARTVIKEATSILILAGAGASVDSGLPDFRGAKGFYRYRDREIPMETINFHDDRGGDLAISWGFILRMMNMFSTCKPHEGYDLVRKICEQKNMKRESSTFVFTSNIDGYFERAGFDRDSVYECHGSTNYLQCIDLCKRRAKNEVYHIDEFNKPKVDKEYNSCDRWWRNIKFEKENLRVLNMDVIPTCPSCAKILRPNISHVTDQPEDICYLRKRKQELKLLDWLRKNKNENVCIIEIGCGTSEHSLRDESELLLANTLSNGHLIRIDPGCCDVPEGHVGIKLGFKEALLEICKEKMF